MFSKCIKATYLVSLISVFLELIYKVEIIWLLVQIIFVRKLPTT